MHFQEYIAKVGSTVDTLELDALPDDPVTPRTPLFQRLG